MSNSANNNVITYYFRTEVKEQLEMPYDLWMRNQRVDFIMGQKDAEGKSYMTVPELLTCRNADGTGAFLLMFQTTPAKLAEYDKLVLTMKGHTHASYPDAFDDDMNIDPNGPLKFTKKTSLDADHLEIMVLPEGSSWKQFDLKKKMEYRVRVNVNNAADLNPPYQEWLKEHIGQMLALKDSDGLSIFSKAVARKAVEDGKEIYVIDYHTTNTQFNYYENTKADHMRSVFGETYGNSKDSFSFDRHLILADEKRRALVETHDRMERGSKGQLLKFETVIEASNQKERI